MLILTLFTFWILPVKKQPANKTKTLLIPFETWVSESAEIPYAVFVMVYNALTELSKPTLGLNDVLNPIRTTLDVCANPL